jgi:AcrR family transcriptional regulator
MSSSRPASSHGHATRQQLLDVAGQVFAERGFADATSKEICARAGTNAAAVNYHFGGREPLYEAVLIEAHHHLVKLEELQRAAAQDGDPRDKLRAVLTAIVQRATAPDAHWATRVLVRELLTPTAGASALAHKAIAPKVRAMQGIVGEILGLPPDSPGLQRSLLLLMGPCMALLLAPRPLRENVLPAVTRDPATLVDDMMCYAEAGLAAIARRYQAR